MDKNKVLETLLKIDSSIKQSSYIPVFLTGPSGTGKTEGIINLLRDFRKIYSNLRFF